TDPPPVKPLPGFPEHGVLPLVAQISNPISNPASVSTPANGQAAGVPPSVEKAYFEQLIENAPEAISIIDREVRIVRVNGEFTRLFGYTAVEAAGKRLDELIVPPDRYITEQKRAEELNAALYNIAARSQSAEDLQSFFAAIHNIVGQLMNARNLYIA